MDVMDADDVRAPGGGAPVLEASALAAIADQLHDDGAARRLATTYLDKLDGRVTRLCGALESGDLEQAMDAVLSLKVSSATVGTRELERMAASMEDLLRGSHVSDACRVGRLLPGAAIRGREALRAHLGA